MKVLLCDACGGESPYGVSYKTVEQRLCKGCAASAVRLNPGVDMEPMKDPTVCARCGAHHGDSDWPVLDGEAVCLACTRRAEGLRFPPWIVGSLIGALLVTIACSVVEWRFTRGFLAYRHGVRAYKAGQFGPAADAMETAAKRIPEESDYQDLAAFYRGRALYESDKPAEAIPYFKESKRISPNDLDIDDWILHAEKDLAWKQGDFGAFYLECKAIVSRHSDGFQDLSEMAWAGACQYAETGEESFREESAAYMKLAKAAKDQPAGDYEVLASAVQKKLESWKEGR